MFSRTSGRAAEMRYRPFHCAAVRIGEYRSALPAIFILSKQACWDIVAIMKQCHACKRALSPAREIGRRDACPQCGADIRCCLNCTFHDPVAPKQCREPAAELVKDKHRATYCEYFLFKEIRESEQPGGTAEDARKALNDLFKK